MSTDPILRVEEPDAALAAVPEAVLHDVWGSRRYDPARLTTTDGDRVTVLDPGRPNPDTGPDFLQARLRIEHTTGALAWTGDVEIHRTSSEWIRHSHDRDPRYNQVVLHVVLLGDDQAGRLVREDGTSLPEAALYPALTESLRSLLYRFYARPHPAFPCAAQFEDVPAAQRRAWIRRLGLERLRHKAARWGEAFGERPDLGAVLYQAMLAALGYAKNAEPMRELARRVPLSTLLRLPDPLDREALLFGVSGLLPTEVAGFDPDSAAYVRELHRRHQRLRRTATPPPMPANAWRFFRLRPANFPTRRIAQAAALAAPDGLFHPDGLVLLRACLLSEAPVESLQAILHSHAPAAFWETHYRFGKASPPASARLGRDRLRRLLIDALLPILLLDADQRDDPHQAERVETVLSLLPGDSDEVTRRFEPLGTRIEDALDAQGLHQLYRTYCTHGRCLDCAVGQVLLRG